MFRIEEECISFIVFILNLHFTTERLIIYMERHWKLNTLFFTGDFSNFIVILEYTSNQFVIMKMLIDKFRKFKI